MGLAYIGPFLMDRETVLVNDARSPAEIRPVIINRVHGLRGGCIMVSQLGSCGNNPLLPALMEWPGLEAKKFLTRENLPHSCSNLLALQAFPGG